MCVPCFVLFFQCSHDSFRFCLDLIRTLQLYFYAFGKSSYPNRLKLHSRYTIYQFMSSLGTEPMYCSRVLYCLNYRKGELEWESFILHSNCKLRWLRWDIHIQIHWDESSESLWKNYGFLLSRLPKKNKGLSEFTLFLQHSAHKPASIVMQHKVVIFCISCSKTLKRSWEVMLWAGNFMSHVTVSMVSFIFSHSLAHCTALSIMQGNAISAGSAAVSLLNRPLCCPPTELHQ